MGYLDPEARLVSSSLLTAATVTDGVVDQVLLLDGAHSALGRHDQLMETSQGCAHMWAAWEIRDRVPAPVSVRDETLARLRPWRH